MCEFKLLHRKTLKKKTQKKTQKTNSNSGPKNTAARSWLAIQLQSVVKYRNGTKECLILGKAKVFTR